jgi:hypothetical protein
LGHVREVLNDLCAKHSAFNVPNPKLGFENWLPRDIVIITGDCPTGVDSLSAIFARANECQYVGFPADWKKHGRAGGPIRNQQMLDEGKPDLVVAFPGGKGTADMVRRARAAGIPVMEVKHPHFGQVYESKLG